MTEFTVDRQGMLTCLQCPLYQIKISALGHLGISVNEAVFHSAPIQISPHVTISSCFTV